MTGCTAWRAAGLVPFADRGSLHTKVPAFWALRYSHIPCFCFDVVFRLSFFLDSHPRVAENSDSTEHNAALQPGLERSCTCFAQQQQKPFSGSRSQSSHRNVKNCCFVVLLMRILRRLVRALHHRALYLQSFFREE